MKPDEASVVDERLAALKAALEHVPAPPLRTRAAPPEPIERPPVPARRRSRARWRLVVPATLGIAAALLLAIVVSTPPEPVVEPAPVAIAARGQGDYLAAPVLVPVAVQSTTRGPELHYLDAQIVRDGYGNTRVVFVGSIVEE